MDVRIRYCVTCPSRRRMALQIADAVKAAIGIEIPLEKGAYGECTVLIDGQAFVPKERSFGNLSVYTSSLVDELCRRSAANGPPRLTADGPPS
jgi:hypothetical protein